MRILGFRKNVVIKVRAVACRHGIARVPLLACPAVPGAIRLRRACRPVYMEINLLMQAFTFTAANEDDTARLGAALAEVLPAGAVAALYGALGAGKTRLVQALAQALGIDRRQVTSPTFVLIQEYHGRKILYHIDAYRIRDEDEFLALGPDEYFESRRPGAPRMGRPCARLPAAGKNRYPHRCNRRKPAPFRHYPHRR